MITLVIKQTGYGPLVLWEETLRVSLYEAFLMAFKITKQKLDFISKSPIFSIQFRRNNMFEYMPHFEDNLGNIWEVNTINFVIMGFGRGLFVQAYCQDLKQEKTFTYSYLKDELMQWNSCETVDCQPLDGNFQSICQKMFKAFDNKE